MVRRRGFEPLQLEQMVLQYVETHARITRHGVEDLCRLNEHSGRRGHSFRLLKRLVLQSRLRQEWNWRAAEGSDIRWQQNDHHSGKETRENARAFPWVTNQLNKVNPRKEFFRADLAQIRAEVDAQGVKNVHWTLTAEAQEYR